MLDLSVAGTAGARSATLDGGSGAVSSAPARASLEAMEGRARRLGWAVAGLPASDDVGTCCPCTRFPVRVELS